MKNISEAQLKANRANAQKSTGPRTEEGKRRASLNALKHGCTSQTIILPGEDAAHFARFHQSLNDSLSPANALEESLVETLAQNQWAINRTRAHEASLFALGHEQFAESIDTAGDQAIQSALAGATVFKLELESLKIVSLYLQRNSRMYESTLKQLIGLQATRKAEEKEELEEAVAIAQIHAQAHTAFHPADYGFDCSPAKVEMLLRRKNATAAHSRPTVTVTGAA
jgi:hypothetical protein